MKLKNNQGFTLAELLIAILLIAILSGVATVGLMSQLPKLRLSGAARRVMTDLMLARMQAVSKNTPVQVSFTGNQYVFDGATTVISDTFRGVTLSVNGNVTFQPTGTTYSPLLVTLNGGPGLAPKYVDVSIAGRVRIR